MDSRDKLSVPISAVLCAVADKVMCQLGERQPRRRLGRLAKRQRRFRLSNIRMLLTAFRLFHDTSDRGISGRHHPCGAGILQAGKVASGRLAGLDEVAQMGWEGTRKETECSAKNAFRRRNFGSGLPQRQHCRRALEIPTGMLHRSNRQNGDQTGKISRNRVGQDQKARRMDWLRGNLTPPDLAENGTQGVLKST